MIGNGCVMVIGGNEDKRAGNTSLPAEFVRRTGRVECWSVRGVEEDALRAHARQWTRGHGLRRGAWPASLRHHRSAFLRAAAAAAPRAGREETWSDGNRPRRKHGRGLGSRPRNARSWCEQRHGCASRGAGDARARRRRDAAAVTLRPLLDYRSVGFQRPLQPQIEAVAGSQDVHQDVRYRDDVFVADFGSVRMRDFAVENKNGAFADDFERVAGADIDGGVFIDADGQHLRVLAENDAEPIEAAACCEMGVDGYVAPVAEARGELDVLAADRAVVASVDEHRAGHGGGSRASAADDERISVEPLAHQVAELRSGHGAGQAKLIAAGVEDARSLAGCLQQLLPLAVDAFFHARLDDARYADFLEEFSVLAFLLQRLV